MNVNSPRPGLSADSPRTDDTKGERRPQDRTRQELQTANQELAALRARQVRGIPIERAYSLLNRPEDGYKSSCNTKSILFTVFGLTAAIGGVVLVGRSLGMERNYEAEGGTYLAVGALGSMISGCCAFQNMRQWAQTRSLQPHRVEIESHMQQIRPAEAKYRQLETEDFLVDVLGVDTVDIIRGYDEGHALPDRPLAARSAPRQAWPAAPADHVVEMPD